MSIKARVNCDGFQNFNRLCALAIKFEREKCEVICNVKTTQLSIQNDGLGADHCHSRTAFKSDIVNAFKIKAQYSKVPQF